MNITFNTNFAVKRNSKGLVYSAHWEAWINDRDPSTHPNKYQAMVDAGYCKTIEQAETFFNQDYETCVALHKETIKQR